MRNAGVFDGLTVICPQCGTYSLVGAEAHARSERWSAELKLALSCATRQASEAEAPLWLEGSNAEDSPTNILVHAYGKIRTGSCVKLQSASKDLVM